MNKWIILLIISFTCSCFAHFPIYVETKDENGAVSAQWTPIQLGVIPHDNLQIFKENTEVYGISLGLGALQQKSSVFSFAPINTLNKNYFLQIGILVTGSTHNYGIAVSPLANMVNMNRGLQLGLFNLESNFGYRSSDEQKGFPGISIGLINGTGSIQIGLLNFNPQGLIPWFPLFNFPVKPAK